MSATPTGETRILHAAPLAGLPEHSLASRGLLLDASGGAAGRRQFALLDLRDGAAQWRLACSLGWLDIKLRYRGSALGPFWLTLSSAVMVGSMGLIYGTLFGVKLSDYLPFLALSIILWQSGIGGLAGEACTVFLDAEKTIRSIRMPFTVQVLRCVVRNAIVLGHNLIVPIGVFAIFDAWPGFEALLALPGIVLWSCDAIAACFLLGSICARFSRRAADRRQHPADRLLYHADRLEAGTARRAWLVAAAKPVLYAAPGGARAAARHLAGRHAVGRGTRLQRRVLAVRRRHVHPCPPPARFLGMNKVEAATAAPRAPAFLRIEGLSLDFPIYHSGARSLKKTVLSAASGRLGPARTATGSPVAGRPGSSTRASGTPPSGTLPSGTGRVVVQALRDINVSLVSGDRLGIVGANGAGKSSLLRAMAGIYEPACGRVHVGGTLNALLDPNLGMNLDLTGRENIVLRGRYVGLGNAAIRDLEDDVQAFAALGEFLDLPVRTYSSGMVVRLGFGLATAIAPQVLLMDEWFMAGDSAFQDKAHARLESVVRGAEILVLTSHMVSVLKTWCTRVLWLEGGRVRDDGPAEEVIERYIGSVGL